MLEAIHPQPPHIPLRPPTEASNRSAGNASEGEGTTPAAPSDVDPSLQWFMDWATQSPLPETYPQDVIKYYWANDGRVPCPDSWKLDGIELDRSNPPLVLLRDEVLHITAHNRLPPGSSRLVDLVGNPIPEKYLSVSDGPAFCAGTPADGCLTGGGHQTNEGKHERTRKGVGRNKGERGRNHLSRPNQAHPVIQVF
jgi:hypothetical protein